MPHPAPRAQSQAHPRHPQARRPARRTLWAHARRAQAWDPRPATPCHPAPHRSSPCQSPPRRRTLRPMFPGHPPRREESPCAGLPLWQPARTTPTPRSRQPRSPATSRCWSCGCWPRTHRSRHEPPQRHPSGPSACHGARRHGFRPAFRERTAHRHQAFRQHRPTSAPEPRCRRRQRVRSGRRCRRHRPGACRSARNNAPNREASCRSWSSKPHATSHLGTSSAQT